MTRVISQHGWRGGGVSGVARVLLLSSTVAAAATTSSTSTATAASAAAAYCTATLALSFA